MAKIKKKSKGRKYAALAVLAILFLTAVGSLLTPVKAHAEDVPLLSAQRLAFGAQVGYQFDRETTVDTGWKRTPSVKLVPVYRIFGQPDRAKGSFALVLPVEARLTGTHPVSFGAFLSVVLWDGQDGKP